MSFSVGAGGPTPKIPPEEIEKQEKSLTGIQGQAKLWTELVAPIIGVTTVLGFGIKTGDILKLDTGAKWAVILIGMAAILAITASIFQASKAATGGDHLPTGGNSVEYSHALTMRAKQTTEGIRRARWLTVVGVVLACIAILVAVGGDPKPAPAHAWVLNVPSSTPSDGRVYCGSLATMEDSGAFVLVPAATETSLPTRVVTDFDNLSQVPSCKNPAAPAAEKE